VDNVDSNRLDIDGPVFQIYRLSVASSHHTKLARCISPNVLEHVCVLLSRIRIVFPEFSSACMFT